MDALHGASFLASVSSPAFLGSLSMILTPARSSPCVLWPLCVILFGGLRFIELKCCVMRNPQSVTREEQRGILWTG